ncbi:unnamed protein product [Polarella glacialis]|uniref:Uncharacterized protein n=1 Tax=Polarella glacialis TaxID=89957 RepID=A0A813JK83_POLGL|nr:unnamed protein product [Polarella glacialis]CAE8679213.1 unnamed protein product [Polarella glacialis]
MRYSAALHGEFTSLSEIAAAIVDQNAQGLACVEPSVFEALGIKMLGHKLLLSKGIVALASESRLELLWKAAVLTGSAIDRAPWPYA